MIYLDSAATSLRKPEAVRAAVNRALRLCSSPGRGSHTAARAAADIVFSCRSAAAEFYWAGQAGKGYIYVKTPPTP
jgi:selenocysteine lyase/cysteine desulfurase